MAPVIGVTFESDAPPTRWVDAIVVRTHARPHSPATLLDATITTWRAGERARAARRFVPIDEGGRLRALLPESKDWLPCEGHYYQWAVGFEAESGAIPQISRSDPILVMRAPNLLTPDADLCAPPPPPNA
ncbi:MAG: hypothetical protein FJ091_09630 [Deltaproteobacteria bacterium]|nr:hypothetical protein [Deltaproteobacteria bacterium]